ncbi:MAG: hypothetical protein GXP55_10145 [Deltaproteobacteria bacterium]|nr:hypothetical protein [Deltaproteobacteria bacterium]
MWEALRRAGRFSELDLSRLPQLLGDAASLPAEGRALGDLLHRHYRRAGVRIAQRRSARDGYVALFSDEPASAGRWVEQLRALSSTLSNLRLEWGDRPLGRVVLAAGDVSVPVPPDALLLRAQRPGDHDRVFGSIGLVAVTNLLLAAWGDHRRFVPLDGAPPLEAYYLIGPLEALEIDAVDGWAAPLDEFGDITGWEPESLRMRVA